MTAQLADVLAWVLIHSLWQGILIAMMVYIMLRVIPARYADARYTTCLVGLLGLVLSMLATGSLLTSRGNSTAASITAPAAVAYSFVPKRSVESERSPLSTKRSSEVTSSSVPVQNQRFVRSRAYRSPRWATWMITAWLIGAAGMVFRTIAAIIEVRSWRYSVAIVDEHGRSQLVLLLQELCEQLRFRRVISVIVSDRVNVPSIVGVMWPCILVPSAMLTGIPPDQWRVILAHELAHIRRYDVLVNLIQMLVESIVFYNPAVWWLSRADAGRARSMLRCPGGKDLRRTAGRCANAGGICRESIGRFALGRNCSRFCICQSSVARLGDVC